jgi:hypothetical protein
MSVLFELERFVQHGTAFVWRTSDFFNREVQPGVSLHSVLMSFTQDKRTAYLRKLSQITQECEAADTRLSPRRCTSVGGTCESLDAASFWKAHVESGGLISLDGAGVWSKNPFEAVVEDAEGHLECEVVVWNVVKRSDLAGRLPHYVPNPKHTVPFAGASHMALADTVAQQVLETAVCVAGQKKRFALHRDVYYVFQPNGPGSVEFDGYPVDENEVPAVARRKLS